MKPQHRAGVMFVHHAFRLFSIKDHAMQSFLSKSVGLFTVVREARLHGVRLNSDGV